MANFDITGFGGAAQEMIKQIGAIIAREREPYLIRKRAKAQEDSKDLAQAREIRREEMLSRASARLASIEVFRQENIENIVRKAAEKILRDELPTKPMHPDWLVTFIESSKDTSDEMLQEIWASVLAGEFDEAGRHSRRTLSMLQNLSREEAEAILIALGRLCGRIIDGEAQDYINVFIGSRWHHDEHVRHDNPIFNEELPNWKRLIECGFLDNRDFIFELTAKGRIEAICLDKETVFIFNEIRVLLNHEQPKFVGTPSGRHTFPPIRVLKFDGWTLTSAGTELAKTLEYSFDEPHFKHFVDALTNAGVLFTIEEEGKQGDAESSGQTNV